MKNDTRTDLAASRPNNVRRPVAMALALAFIAGAAAARSKPALLIVGHPTAHSWEKVAHPAFTAKVIDPDLEPLTAAAYSRFATIMGAAGEPLYVVAGPYMEPLAASGRAGLSQFLDRVAAAEGDQLAAEAALVVRRHLLRASAIPAAPEQDLRAIVHSPLYDHVGGGFFRCVQGELPCFDKLLADQARFALRYIEAWKSTGDPLFAEVARATLDAALDDLRDERGLFVAGMSADSIVARGGPELLEGAYYVWRVDEIRKLLAPPLADIVIFHFKARAEGNVPGKPDFHEQNVLLPRPRSETRAKFGLSEDELSEALRTARARLREVRSKRPEPKWHTPIVTAHNAAMISALARAAVAFDEPRYGEAAARAARALQPKNLTPRDHALLTRALFDLYEVTFDLSLLTRAMSLVAGEAERVPDAIAALAPQISIETPSLEAMRQIVIAGDRAAADTQALLRAARRSDRTNTIILMMSSERTRAAIAQWLPGIRAIAVPKEIAVATVCDPQGCRTPTSDPNRLAAWLE